MPAELVLKNYSNIIGIKEASGDMDQIMRIIKNKPSNFIVLSGDDGLTLPMIYMGSEGVISVIAQLYPKEYSRMVSEGLNGSILKANELHYNLYSYYDSLYDEGNPVGIKAALEVFGLCNRYVRKPLIPASNQILDKLKILMKQ